MCKQSVTKKKSVDKKKSRILLGTLVQAGWRLASILRYAVAGLPSPARERSSHHPKTLELPC